CRLEADRRAGCAAEGGRNRIFADVQADVIGDRRMTPYRLVAGERACLELLATGWRAGTALVVAVGSAEALQLQAKAALLERTSADSDGAGRVGELGLVGGQCGRRVDSDDPLVPVDRAGRPGVPVIGKSGAATDKAQQRRRGGRETAFGRCGAACTPRRARER